MSYNYNSKDPYKLEKSTDKLIKMNRDMKNKFKKGKRDYIVYLTVEDCENKPLENIKTALRYSGYKLGRCGYSEKK